LGIAAGTINEVALGSDWPRVPQRLEKFDEALKVIRSLFDDEFVTLEGKHFTLRSANLYTKPRSLSQSTSPPAVRKSATIAGRYGDGIIIPNGVEAPVELMRERIMPAVKKGAEEAGRDPSTIKVAVLATVAYAEDADKILAGKAKEYWNHTVLSDLMEEPVSDPRINERKGKSVDDQAFRAAG